MAKDAKTIKQIKKIEKEGGVVEYDTDPQGNLIIKISGFIVKNIAYKAMGNIF